MGRPQLHENKRTEVVKFRVSRLERGLIRQVAGRNLSDFMRRMILACVGDEMKKGAKTDIEKR